MKCGYRGGQYLNFDLAYPSSAIPDNFFPSDEKLYGYKARNIPALRPRTHLGPQPSDVPIRPVQDFGVWNITYASVSCKEWKGWGNEAAKGSAPDLGGCCPANPTARIPFFSSVREGGVLTFYFRQVRIPAPHTPMRTA